MDDGPDSANGSYEYNGTTYRLEEAGESAWAVYRADEYLGVLAQTYPAAGDDSINYTAKLEGEENLVSEEWTDDWRAALEHLLDEVG